MTRPICTVPFRMDRELIDDSNDSTVGVLLGEVFCMIAHEAKPANEKIIRSVSR